MSTTINPKLNPRSAESAAMLLESVNETASYVAALVVTLLAVVAYLWFLTAGVTHEMLLRNSALSMPLVDVSMPVDRFFFWAPCFLLILHANVLHQAEKLRRKIALLRRRHAGSWALWSPLLAPAAAGADVMSLQRPGRFVSLGRIGSWVSYSSPCAALLWMEFHFLPYQSTITTWLHCLLVSVDVALLFYCLIHLPHRQGGVQGRRRMDGHTSVFTLFLVVALFGAFVMPWIEGWNRLEVRGRLLVAAEPAAELVAALTAQDMPRDEIYARHSRGLSLAGRSFRHADFTGSQLYRADLRGADLYDATLVGSDLSGADLGPLGAESWSANYGSRDERRRRLVELVQMVQTQDAVPTQLDAADLSFARLVGTRLTLVNLEGSRLDDTTLLGAEMMEVRAARSSFGKADLRLTDLFRSELDGAYLSEARFSGASLANASLVGADMTQAVAHAVDLDGATLVLARMRGIRMTSSSLRVADLTGADLEFSHLHGSRGLLAQWTRLRGAWVADACVCPECVETAPATPGSAEPGGVVAADLRRVRRRFSPQPAVDPFDGVDDLPLPEAGPRLTAVERWEAEMCREFAPCLPTVRVEGGSAGAAEGVNDHSSDAQVRGFYAAMAGELIRRACGTEEDDDARKLSAAISDAVACAVTGWRETGDAADEPLESEISRSLSEAVGDARSAALCPALRDAFERVGSGGYLDFCR